MEGETPHNCCTTIHSVQGWRSSAIMVDAGFGEWWRERRRWARGWTLEAAQRPVYGTESPNVTPCLMRRSMPFIRRVLLRCFMVLVDGPTRSQCLRHCASGNLVSFVEYCACAGDQMLGGSHETYWSHCCSDVEKAWSTTFTYVGDATCANCCLANGPLSR